MTMTISSLSSLARASRRASSATSGRLRRRWVKQAELGVQVGQFEQAELAFAVMPSRLPTLHPNQAAKEPRRVHRTAVSKTQHLRG